MRIFKKYIKRKEIQSHSELLNQIFEQNIDGFSKKPKIIEVGSGITTDLLNKLSLKYECEVISIDNNPSKVKFLNNNIKNKSPKLSFLVGDSLEILKNIIEKSKIDLLFLDSVPSAMYT